MFGAAACVAGYMSTCCPLAVALFFELLAASKALFSVWMATCRPSACKVLTKLAWVFVTAAAPLLAWLAKSPLASKRLPWFIAPRKGATLDQPLDAHEL